MSLRERSEESRSAPLFGVGEAFFFLASARGVLLARPPIFSHPGPWTRLRSSAPNGLRFAPLAHRDFAAANVLALA